jgi:hypothetical protein
MPEMKSVRMRAPNSGGGSMSLGRDVEHFGNRIDDDTHLLARLALLIDGFDDHDAAALGHRARRPPEAHGQIDDRHDRAAQVDHPADEGGYQRYLGQLPVLDDFADRQDADGEHLLAEMKGEELLLLLGRPGDGRMAGPRGGRP